jgi:beta-lactamase class C
LIVKTGWQTIVQQIIEDVLSPSQVPGIVIARTQGDGPVEHLVLGTDGLTRPLQVETLFPVASITKMATALAILRLAACGALSLDDPLECHLPDAGAADRGIRLRMLLSHTSGLPLDLAPELAPYTSELDWPTLAHACLRTQLDHPPQTRVNYSNVGFGLLAIVVERLTGQPFSTALADLVLVPLGIEGYLGREPERAPAWIVGELGEHVGTLLEPFNSAFWRRLALPWGGLVTTATGALGLVRAFVDMPADFLPDDLRVEATRDQTGGMSGGMAGGLEWPQCPTGLGVELHGHKVPHYIPTSVAATSFGHGGTSGCVAWYDPTTKVAWAMFGSRTFESWMQSMPAINGALLVGTG